MEATLEAIRVIKELISEVTGTNKDIYLITREGYIINLEGDQIYVGYNETIERILRDISENPKRARCFSIWWDQNKVDPVIYIPDKETKPEFYTRDGRLTLEGTLAVAEEISHALDGIEDHPTTEALAVLARYLTIRYLEACGDLRLPKSGTGDAIDWALDFVVCRKRGGFGNGYIDTVRPFSKNLSPEYLPRLWLVGLIRELEKVKSFEKVLEIVKEVYQAVREAERPLGVIEGIGLRCKTVPDPSVIRRMYQE